MKKNFCILFFFFFWTAFLVAQSPLNIETDYSVSGVSLEEALDILAEQTKVNIAIGGRLIPKDKVVFLDKKNVSVKRLLDALLSDTDILYKVVEDAIVLYKRPISKYTISGYIEDAFSGEKLIGANVFVPDFEQGTYSNEYGFYSLTLSGGAVDLIYSYTGYNSQESHILLDKNIRLNISLSSTLETVIVVPKNEAIEQKTKLNIPNEAISIKQLKLLPTLGGEADIWRHNYLQAGVNTGTDGVGGLIVRGGSVDQNLVLLDGVPIYNPTHAIGIFSIFNTDAIKSANLYKSNFPARYSGRLSSVMDIRTKEGNKKEYEAEASVSLISGKASIEGPILKDKVSFFLSGRSSFTQWYIPTFTKLVKENNSNLLSNRNVLERGGASDYSFFDINAKIHADFSDKDQLFFSFYKGGDDFSDTNTVTTKDTFPFNLDPFIAIEGIIKDNTNLGFSWGNTTAAFRWNHLFSDQLFANTTVNFSSYNFKSEDAYLSIGSYEDESSDTILVAQKFRSNIETYTAKTDLDYHLSPNHFLRLGLSVSEQAFQPGVFFDETQASNVPLLLDSIAIFDTLDIQTQIAREYTAYLEDDMQITPWLSANIGLHAASWLVDGIRYNSIQPRTSVKAQVHPNWSVYASYSQMVQHLHFLTKSNLGLPGDIWVPSTDQVAPEKAWQSVLGFQYQNPTFGDFSVEGYYKKMDHLISFIQQDSLVILSADDWEKNVAVGQGWTYGVEASVNKTSGKFKGMCNYTLAWSERQFDKINNGIRFPFRYDRRHSFKLAGQYFLNKKLNFNATWIIESGSRLTLPLLEYPVRVVFGGEIIIQDPGPVNERIAEAYHRLDLGINYTIQKKKLSHHLNFGLFNVYNRQNPIFYRIRETETVKVTLLPLLPSFSYGIKFKTKRTSEQK